MSEDEIRRRARLMPSEVIPVELRSEPIDRGSLPQATGTSIALLPWWRRLLSWLRFWSRWRTR